MTIIVVIPPSHSNKLPPSELRTSKDGAKVKSNSARTHIPREGEWIDSIAVDSGTVFDVCRGCCFRVLVATKY